MAKYKWFNAERFESLKESQDANGMQIIVELSPYVTPKGVTGNYNADKGRFTIKFLYIDDEPPAPVINSVHGIQLIIGRHSHKLLTIHIPIDHPPLDRTCAIELKTDILEALNSATESTSVLPRKSLNLDAAKSVIEHDLGELVGA